MFSTNHHRYAPANFQSMSGDGDIVSLIVNIILLAIEFFFVKTQYSKTEVEENKNMIGGNDTFAGYLFNDFKINVSDKTALHNVRKDMMVAQIQTLSSNDKDLKLVNKYYSLLMNLSDIYPVLAKLIRPLLEKLGTKLIEARQASLTNIVGSVTKVKKGKTADGQDNFIDTTSINPETGRNYTQSELKQIDCVENGNDCDDYAGGKLQKPKHKYNGRSYTIRTGSRGGKYILVGKDKKKIYV